VRDRERVLHAIDEHVGPARMTLEGEGEDHTAWRVESDTETWIARLPKQGRPSGPSATRREVAVMDLVRRMLGRWVPEAFVLDDATGLMLYRRVSGTPLQARLAAGTVSATHVEVIGAHLGRFVRDIAGLDANAVDGVIIDDTSLGAWRDECVDLLPAVSPHLSPTNVARIESFVAAEPPGEVDPATLVLTHNDLGAEHVIVDGDGQIAGIIDWSDTAVADPAAELGRCLRDLGEAACARALDECLATSRERRSDVEERALFYARCLAVEDMAYAVRRRRDLIELDRRNIERLFASS
jgi:aminoglycoside phosphotransferase (APT) family kinase protein